jgi:hydrogenase expression/formation protein HypE
MRRHPKGRDAALIGRITKEHAGLVVARTGLGANRVIPLQIGEQLPRIC